MINFIKIHIAFPGLKHVLTAAEQKEPIYYLIHKLQQQHTLFNVCDNKWTWQPFQTYKAMQSFGIIYLLYPGL
jgi:hypothetical protein